MSFVEILLEYVINSHLINRESTMLQAFQISLVRTIFLFLKCYLNICFEYICDGDCESLLNRFNFICFKKALHVTIIRVAL